MDTFVEAGWTDELTAGRVVKDLQGDVTIMRRSDTRGRSGEPDVASDEVVPEADAPEVVEAGDSELEPEADETATELAELNDRYLRLMAEYENYRKRTRREQADLRRMSQADLMLKILPTLDDMTRVASIPNDQTTVQALDEGILLIRRNLMKELEDIGLTRIEAVDAPFDPELHQAVLREAVDDPELDDTVSRVFVEGYVLGDRLVRPSQVEVRQYVEPSD